MSAYAGAYQDSINGFNEHGGIRWGDEVYRYGFVGEDVKLSVTLFDGPNWTWAPFVAGTFVQEFDRSHTLNLPAQTLTAPVEGFPGTEVNVVVPSTAVHFHEDTNYWGGRWGLDIATQSGWRFGADGWAGATGDMTDVGGRAYFMVLLEKPTSAAPPAAPIK